MSTIHEIERIESLISDGGKRIVQQRGNSRAVTLPPGPLEKAGVEPGDEIMVVPSDEEGKLFEILVVPDEG